MSKETVCQKLYKKAKENGKVSERNQYLKLGKKRYVDGKFKGVESTGPHRAIYKNDVIVQGEDYDTGKEIKKVRFTFEEKGEDKFYEKPVYDDNEELHYFVQRMKNFKYGDDLILEYISKGKSGFIQVTPADDDDIPVVEEDPEAPIE